MSHKKFISIISFSICLILLLTGVLVYTIDPYFHYHTPNPMFNYVLDTNSFAYINAGIAKNFDYDTVITGSSMSRALLPTYVDKSFSCKTVKLSMAEARGKDLSELFKILEKQDDLKRIIMGLDTFAYDVDKNYSSYTYPLYLYDDNPLNDVLYLLNKKGLEASFNVLKTTKNQVSPTTMDLYQNYVPTNNFSKDKVIEIYKKNRDTTNSTTYDKEAHRKVVLDNLNQNIIPIIKNRPDIEFLLYFPPYSIIRWGITDNLDKDFQTIQLLIETLISFDNVSLFFYQGNTDIITNLNCYMDTIHFNTEIANDIIDYISVDENKLTKENYLSEINKFKTFVLNYDYERYLQTTSPSE